MDITDYYMLINLLVNPIKNNFMEIRQFVLIFVLIKTAILFTFFNPKSSSIFWSIIQHWIIIKNSKQKNKAKKYYQTNKEKLQERSWTYHRNLSEDEKITKEDYANNTTKNMLDEGTQRKKNI